MKISQITIPRDQLEEKESLDCQDDQLLKYTWGRGIKTDSRLKKTRWKEVIELKCFSLIGQ